MDGILNMLASTGVFEWALGFVVMAIGAYLVPLLNKHLTKIGIEISDAQTARLQAAAESVLAGVLTKYVPAAGHVQKSEPANRNLVVTEAVTALRAAYPHTIAKSGATRADLRAMVQNRLALMELSPDLPSVVTR